VEGRADPRRAALRAGTSLSSPTPGRPGSRTRDTVSFATHAPRACPSCRCPARAPPSRPCPCRACLPTGSSSLASSRQGRVRVGERSKSWRSAPTWCSTRRPSGCWRLSPTWSLSWVIGTRSCAARPRSCTRSTSAPASALRAFLASARPSRARSSWWWAGRPKSRPGRPGPVALYRALAVEDARVARRQGDGTPARPARPRRLPARAGGGAGRRLRRHGSGPDHTLFDPDHLVRRELDLGAGLFPRAGPARGARTSRPERPSRRTGWGSAVTFARKTCERGPERNARPETRSGRRERAGTTSASGRAEKSASA